MEKIQWKVEGMDCSNCALTIHKFLQNEGMKNVKVNFSTGDVLFELNGDRNKEQIAKGIHSLGYTVTSHSIAIAKKTHHSSIPIFSGFYFAFLLHCY